MRKKLFWAAGLLVICATALLAQIVVNGSQIFLGSVSIGGPNPWVDLSAIGGFPSLTNYNFTCVASSNQVVAEASYNFVIRQGIMLVGCGSAPSPVPTSVTPVAEGATGTTTYNYKVSCFGANHGIGAASTAGTITNGPASLTFANFNKVTWTGNSSCAGYVVYGSVGAGSYSQLGYIDALEYDDVGYQSEQTLAAAPSTPPPGAIAGVLSTTIVAISGTTYTLAASASTSVAAFGALAVHDNSPILANAETTLCALGGGTIRIPASDWFFTGNNLLQCSGIRIDVDPGATITTYDSVPFLRLTGIYGNFKVTGGVWSERTLSIPESGTLNPPAILDNGNYVGPGIIYVNGQTFNLKIMNGYLGNSRRAIEFGPSSFTYGFQLDNDWFQAGNSCSYVFHAGNGSSSHDWQWSNITMEGAGTQLCPQEAPVQLGSINHFEINNWSMSDYSPAIPVAILSLKDGGGITIANGGAGIYRFVCNSCDLPSGNGSVFESTSGGGAWTLTGGEYIGTTFMTGSVQGLTAEGTNISPEYDFSAMAAASSYPVQIRNTGNGSVYIGYAYYAGDASGTLAASILPNQSPIFNVNGGPAMTATPFASLSDAATISWNAASYANPRASVTLNGNRTLQLTNLANGGTLFLEVTQGAGAPYSLAAGTGGTGGCSSWNITGGSFGLSTGAGNVDGITIINHGGVCDANTVPLH